MEVQGYGLDPAPPSQREPCYRSDKLNGLGWQHLKQQLTYHYNSVAPQAIGEE